MTAIPSSRFFKTNWLNSHRNQCSKLTRNYYETKIIEDWMRAGLSRHQKRLGQTPATPKNCGIGVDKVQQVLWRAHNLPVVKSVKKLLIYVAQIV